MTETALSVAKVDDVGMTRETRLWCLANVGVKATVNIPANIQAERIVRRC